MSDAEPSFVAKVIGVHETLASASIGHAFGGALALAYYTDDPRATATSPRCSRPARSI